MLAAKLLIIADTIAICVQSSYVPKLKQLSAGTGYVCQVYYITTLQLLYTISDVKQSVCAHTCFQVRVLVVLFRAMWVIAG
jgi:TRAP-type uncharacterized transport system substrate-binding protein